MVGVRGASEVVSVPLRCKLEFPCYPSNRCSRVFIRSPTSGEGAIFAFSGIDGPTCSASNFVLAFGGRTVRSDDPYRRHARAAAPTADPGEVMVATNDCLLVETPGGELIVTFSVWHTAVGQLPAGRDGGACTAAARHRHRSVGAAL